MEIRAASFSRLGVGFIAVIVSLKLHFRGSERRLTEPPGRALPLGLWQGWAAGSGWRRRRCGGFTLVSIPGLTTSKGGCAHPSFQGAEFSGSGAMLGTCTEMWTWSASVKGRGFVAEMGRPSPFQVNCSKHFQSRAGSGRGVHRPYWKGTLLHPGKSGRGCNGPVGKVHFAPLGMRRGRRAGPGRAGVAALAPVSWWRRGCRREQRCSLGCSGRRWRWSWRWRWRWRRDRGGG